jgi:hypothetical protein
MLGIVNNRPVLTILSQAALTLAVSIFTENVDVEEITLRFCEKEVCSDKDWDDLVKFFKAGREEKGKETVRVFTVDVEKRQ